MKKYLNELETEKRNEIIKMNKKLISQLQEDLYKNNLELQYIESKNIMNNEALHAITYHDNYNSFYYTLNDWRKFIININYNYTTSLIDEIKETIDIILQKIDILDSMDYYNDNYQRLDDWLCSKTEEVLQNIEDYLHTFEDYPDEYDAIQYADEMDWLNDYYIEIRDDGSTDNVIRKDVAYTECFI